MPRNPRNALGPQWFIMPKPKVFCPYCGDERLKSELNTHLDADHPGWQYQAIRKLGLHLVA